MKFILLYKKLPTLVKATIWFSIAVIMQKCTNILITPFITRLMTKEDYGTYSLYTTWYSMFLIICTFNLSGSIFNTLLLNNKEKKTIPIVTISFEFFVTFLVFITYIIFTLANINIRGLSLLQGYLIFAQIISTIPTSIWIAKKKFDNEYIKCTIFLMIQSIFIIVLNLLSVFLTNGNLNALIISTIFPQIIFSSFVLISLLKDKIKVFDKAIWKYLFIVGFPLIFHYLANSILGQSDRVMIEYFYGKEETAVYSLAHSISFLLQTLITGLSAAYDPWLMKKIRNNDNKMVNKSGILMLLLISIAVSFVSILGPELIILFGGAKYLSGSIYIPLLSSTIIVLLVYNLYSVIEFTYGKTMVSSLVTVAAAILNVILNLIFIPKYGPVSATYTTLFSYFFMMIVHCLYSKYILKIENNNKKYFNFTTILLLMFVCVALNICIGFIYSYFIARMIILALLLLICIFTAYIVYKKFNKKGVN